VRVFWLWLGFLCVWLYGVGLVVGVGVEDDDFDGCVVVVCDWF